MTQARHCVTVRWPLVVQLDVGMSGNPWRNGVAMGWAGWAKSRGKTQCRGLEFQAKINLNNLTDLQIWGRALTVGIFSDDSD